MFIDQTDLIKVKIHYKKVGRNFIAHTDKSFEDVDESEREEYKSVEIGMKPLTWELYNEIQDTSWTPDPTTGQKTFNYRVYKEVRLTQLIKEWDAQTKNDKGEFVPVPVTKQNIMNMSPDIAEALLEAYDEASTLTGEEEKK